MLFEYGIASIHRYNTFIYYCSSIDLSSMPDALNDLLGEPGNSDSILQNLTTICRVRKKDENEMCTSALDMYFVSFLFDALV